MFKTQAYINLRCQAFAIKHFVQFHVLVVFLLAYCQMSLIQREQCVQILPVVIREKENSHTSMKVFSQTLRLSII